MSFSINTNPQLKPPIPPPTKKDLFVRNVSIIAPNGKKEIITCTTKLHLAADDCKRYLSTSYKGEGAKEKYTFFKSQAGLALRLCKTVDLATSDNITPLMFAAHICQDIAIRILLEHKADPNFKDKEGATALHYALYRTPRLARIILWKEQKQVMHLLLQNGANIKNLSQIKHSILNPKNQPLTPKQEKLINEVTSEFNASKKSV